MAVKKKSKKKSSTKKASKKKVVKKTIAKKKLSKKKLTKKKVSKKKLTKKKVVKKATTKKTVVKKSTKKKPVKKVTKKSAPKKTKASSSPAKKTIPAKVESKKMIPSTTKKDSSQDVVEKNTSKAPLELKCKEAITPIEEVAPKEIKEEDQFDPEAFFEASGGEGIFRAHVMRKERVDLNIFIRYRLNKGPMVYQAEMINLSKGGLCLKTEKTLETEQIIRIEIPLPHTSELFRVQAKVIWSQEMTNADSFFELDDEKNINTGLTFMPMNLAKQAVINNFIQQRRDELIMAKIGLDKFSESAPVSGVD